MPESLPVNNNFIIKLTDIVLNNISNEQFGVSELASETGMSRSNLLRKITKTTGLSASQFIRQIRLEKAKEMLKQNSYTVSEISYKVGFSSPSYFIKCFREHYGYPPGESGKKEIKEIDSDTNKQPSQTHQLVAIMFTDIEGYTALMQQDEKRALAFRNRHREVFDSVTKKYKGKILQYYGDGTLSTFNSAIDAVRCGIEIQLTLQSDPKIPLRIGIHSGDILFAQDGIVGDGVNVASRIESLAVSGSVFISGKVYDEVKNQSGIQTVSLGEFELKNIDKPIEVFAITNEGLIVPDIQQIKGKVEAKNAGNNGEPSRKGKWRQYQWIPFILLPILVAYLVTTVNIFEPDTWFTSSNNQASSKKSIAVLPFINDSNDSTNVYIINGLMESTLNNLQKIKGLRVISRTSVEKYRNNPKTITEIAKELGVTYIIEGSGQKIGDQIMLNIQLIEGTSDRHLWAERYNRDAKDIFKLQIEVAKNISEKIEVIITPEEAQMINKEPTENLEAYDYFLQGLDCLNDPENSKLDEAILYYSKAIKLDNKFARAYAGIAVAYYLKDEGKSQKVHSDSINYFADKALFHDPKLPQSLIAKALFYMNNTEYKLAGSYFEKALEYNPNSDLAFLFLIELYVNYLPDTEKYLEYALRGLEIDIGAYDSMTASFSYLHISNAFIQSGFIDEAEKYINRSLDYFAQNIYSEYVKAYIIYAKEQNLEHLRNRLLLTLKKDTNRLDVLQEVGKSFYYLRDFENAYKYYKRYVDLKNAYKLKIYQAENAKIGVVYSNLGLETESQQLLGYFRDYAEKDQSIYKHLSLSMYYSYKGNKKSAIEHLRLFSEQDHYHYWTILFLEIDPLADNIREMPEFKKIFLKIEDKFWDYHKQIRKSLEEKSLI